MIDDLHSCGSALLLVDDTTFIPRDADAVESVLYAEHNVDLSEANKLKLNENKTRRLS